MIPPRRAEAAADPALLDGVLGAAAMLRALRAALAELAEEGGEGGEGGDAAGAPVDGEVVDVVLGLAALADAVARQLPEDGDPPGRRDGDGGSYGDGAACARRELAIGELLR